MKTEIRCVGWWVRSNFASLPPRKELKLFLIHITPKILRLNDLIKDAQMYFYSEKQMRIFKFNKQTSKQIAAGTSKTKFMISIAVHIMVKVNEFFNGS